MSVAISQDGAALRTLSPVMAGEGPPSKPFVLASP